MNELRKNLLALYLILNGFVLSIVILMLIFERPEGFLHYSPGMWLDYVIVLTSILTGILLPLRLRFAYNRGGVMLLGKSVDAENFKFYESIVIIFSWFAFGLAMLSFLYQTSMWVRYITVIISVYALVNSFPTFKKIDKYLNQLKH